MREILFRGKRVDNDAWVEGLLTIMWGQYHIIQPNDENTAYPIILKTIGQYTGLTDKNGTKILKEISLIFLVARTVTATELFSTMSMKLNLQLCVIHSIRD